MNLEALCYLGLLRFPDQLEPSIALLPEAERQRASSFLSTVKNLPRAELLKRWSTQREGEYVVLRRKASERGGIVLDELPPAFRQLCISWLLESDDE